MPEKRPVPYVLVLALACLALCACVTQAPAPQASAGYVTRDVPVFRKELTDETIALRFFDETPNIAYVSMADFYHLMLPEGSMDVERLDDGTYRLQSHTGASEQMDMGAGLGGTAVVDVAAGTLTSPDLLAFTNLMSQMQEGMDNTYYDGAPYVRVSRVEYDREPKPVTLDFARYGIALHADDAGVYLPFQTVSAIYSDLANHYATYNGEKVYVNADLEYDPARMRDPSFFEPILASRTRPADLAAFSYAHLRFVVDYFYGLPGRNAARLGGHDLDATLAAMGESGEAIRRGLASTDLVEYLAAGYALTIVLQDGGHTMFGYEMDTALSEDESYSELVKAYQDLMGDTTHPLGAFIDQAVAEYDYKGLAAKMARKRARDEAYGDKAYVKEGDTAVIVFDNFTVDNPSWSAYLDGSGAMPGVTEEINAGMFTGLRDSVAIVKDGLDRAEADPDVRNVVLDVSNNVGGSLDTLMLVTSLVSGRAVCTYQNTLTDQFMSEYFDIDRNLDGSFDERDGRVDYSDLRFAVLTSKSSFSCGNLFPRVLAEDDIMVMGERSGGGSCAVEKSVTADGTCWSHSSWRARLTDESGADIDGGIPVDVDLLERADAKTVSVESVAGDGTMLQIPDYSCLYDVGLLSEVMNEFYGEEALPVAA